MFTETRIQLKKPGRVDGDPSELKRAGSLLKGQLLLSSSWL